MQTLDQFVHIGRSIFKSWSKGLFLLLYQLSSKKIELDNFERACLRKFSDSGKAGFFVINIMGNEQGGEFDPSREDKREDKTPPNQNSGNGVDDDIMCKSQKSKKPNKKTNTQDLSRGDEVKDVENIQSFLPKEYQGLKLDGK